MGHLLGRGQRCYLTSTMHIPPCNPPPPAWPSARLQIPRALVLRHIASSMSASGGWLLAVPLKKLPGKCRPQSLQCCVREVAQESASGANAGVRCAPPDVAPTRKIKKDLGARAGIRCFPGELGSDMMMKTFRNAGKSDGVIAHAALFKRTWTV